MNECLVFAENHDLEGGRLRPTPAPLLLNLFDRLLFLPISVISSLEEAMDDSLLPPLTRVAVVGAGALGLARESPSSAEPFQGPTRSSLKPCLALPLPLPPEIHQLIAAGVDRSKIVAYEARKEVGGLWFALSAFAPVESHGADWSTLLPSSLSSRTFEPEAGECEVRFSASGLAVPATKPERKGETLPPTALYETLRTNLPKTVCVCSVSLTPHLPHPSPLSLS